MVQIVVARVAMVAVVVVSLLVVPLKGQARVLFLMVVVDLVDLAMVVA
jgi:hypothetical protein